MVHAPISVFGFNRPLHLHKTLTALSRNLGAEKSELYIFIDGPRSDEETRLTQASIDVASKFRTNFNSFNLIAQEQNLGLAKSVISGVSSVLEIHEKIIVVEDDLVTSRYFLDFINRGLEKYALNQEVASIHGYVTPLSNPAKEPFFLRGADCWGWGTWRDRWEFFNENGQDLISKIEQLQLGNLLDLNGAYPFTQMLRDQIVGKNDSWAIRWHASMFLEEKLTLFPSETYVENIGFDGSGTHTGITNIYYSPLSEKRQELPDEITLSESMTTELSKWYREVYFGRRTKLNKVLIKPYLWVRNLLKRIVSTGTMIISNK